MDYTFTTLKKPFKINDIVTIHYFEYSKDYSYFGEKHNFWELVYVDKGEITIQMDDNHYKLEQGMIAFHQPNEYHNIKANGLVAPNIIVVSFICKSKAMNFFKKQLLPLSDNEKTLLSIIVKEAANSFSSKLNDTLLKKLERKSEPLFGSEQLISSSLELLLISLYRNFCLQQKNTTFFHNSINHNLVNKILEIMQDKINDNLSISYMSKVIGASKTSISTIFKEKTGESPMSYFSKLKINYAKKMIREGNHNMTQISNYLGFESIHSFSRKFKKITNMTPTEYGKSIKATLEIENNL